MLLPAFLERHLPSSIRALISSFWGRFVGSAFKKNSSNHSWRIVGQPPSLRDKSSSEFKSSAQNENSFTELKNENGIEIQILQTRNVVVESLPADPTTAAGVQTHPYPGMAASIEDIEAQRLQPIGPVSARRGRC
jgi:hypothetical protein